MEFCSSEKAVRGGSQSTMPWRDSDEIDFDLLQQDPLWFGPMPEQWANDNRLSRARPTQRERPGHYITPCEQELGSDGTGRYPTVISQQFMTGVVQIKEPNRNLVCKCIEETKMECIITVRFNSLEHEIVKRRIGTFASRPPAADLQPFFAISQHLGIYGNAWIKNLYFQHTHCYPPVVAEIIVQTNKLPPTITRSQSAPTIFHQEFRMIRKSVCTDGASNGVCPITRDEFVDHSVVYILKEDKQKVDKGESVVCISAEGLRQLSIRSEDRSFKDPLNRENGKLLRIENDYLSYIIFEDDPSKCDRAVNTDSRHLEMAKSFGNAGKATVPARVVLQRPTVQKAASFADTLAANSVPRKSIRSPSEAGSSTDPLVFSPSFTGIEKASQTDDTEKTNVAVSERKYHFILESLLILFTFTILTLFVYTSAFEHPSDNTYIVLL